ncbi:hypothetical protein FH715_18535 [Streptomyces sedi]|uniref:Uncharacterized protein n=1 Tax=Streptomyces sedi TaxID=555059 RepID=A0A5C4UWV1_9ACTN|nr:hypothetical protein FH715_18535 [Streptomyces sedi]
MAGGRWLVVSGQWSVVSGQWSVVSGQWSVVSRRLLSGEVVGQVVGEVDRRGGQLVRRGGLVKWSSGQAPVRCWSGPVLACPRGWSGTGRRPLR